MDSSVGIATGYRLNGLGIESRPGRDFPNPPDQPLGPASILYNGYRIIPINIEGEVWVWPPIPSRTEVKDVSLLQIFALVACSGGNLISLNKKPPTQIFKCQSTLTHHDNSKTKLQKPDCLLKNFVDTCTVDMLVYNQSAYVQTTKILRIIISEIKWCAIHNFSYYLVFSRIPTTF